MSPNYNNFYDRRLLPRTVELLYLYCQKETPPRAHDWTMLDNTIGSDSYLCSNKQQQKITNYSFRIFEPCFFRGEARGVLKSFPGVSSSSTLPLSTTLNLNRLYRTGVIVEGTEAQEHLGELSSSINNLLPCIVIRV